MSDHAADDTVPEVDESRRKFLIAATAGTGAVGAVLTAVPFVASWKPSESARAAGLPTEVDLSKIEPGQMATFFWRKQQIYVVKRTPDMLASLAAHDGELKDPKSEKSEQPEYAKNDARAIKPEVLVLIGTCTHLGLPAEDPLHAGRCFGHGELAGRLLLPLPWFEVRPGGPRVRRLAGLGEPQGSAIQLRRRQQAHHRRRCHGRQRGCLMAAIDGQGRPGFAPGSTSVCRSTSSSPTSSRAITRRRISTSGTSSARWRCWCSSCRS